MPVKVLNAGGNGSFADVAAGITWSADHGTQVINLSVGGASPSAVLQDAVNYAYGKGVLLVAAAGNTGSGVILYPARYPNVIAVGAVDNTNNHAGFSNFGPELDLAAPGASIYSTVIGGYGYLSGTSMAAPYVSGLAAILRGYPAGFSPDAIEWVMESTALDLGAAGRDNLYGYGLIQMDAALKLVLPPTQALIPAGGRNLFTPTFIVTVTNTNTALASPTNTPALLPLAIQPTASGTSEVQAVPTHQGQQVRIQDLPSWQLPCAGLTFLFAGLLLLWAARRR
jgi:subtilisin family serine protease